MQKKEVAKTHLPCVGVGILGVHGGKVVDYTHFTTTVSAVLPGTMAG